MINSRRSYNLAIIASLIGLVFFYLWNFGDHPGSPIATDAGQGSDLKDVYLIKAKQLRFTSEGYLDSSLYSDSVDHYPARQHATLKNPDIQFFEQGQLSWTITAKSGIVHDQRDQIDFSQQVLLESPNRQAQLKTPFLSAFPERELAVTDRPVTLVNPQGFTRAIGMHADLKSQVVKLKQQVRGQYHATPQ